MGREGAVPPLTGFRAWPISVGRGRAKGALPPPLAIPGISGWLTLRVPSSLVAGLRSVIDALPTRR